MGEVPDFENLVISHGICRKCHPKTTAFAESDYQHAIFLRDIYRKLFAAGRRSDLAAAEHILNDAVAANCRPVDILIGIMAPMLYQIGEDWSRGKLSVEGEHRFTAFCKKTFDLVATRVRFGARVVAMPAPSSQNLLINAPGNTHTLAIRILALWLMTHDIPAQIAGPFADLDELVGLVRRMAPKKLLISIALTEQHDSVRTIVERMQDLPASRRPEVIVGGYAVKRGLVSQVPGARLMADISSLVSDQI
jgi:methanogenic corrinoid protein MtbC1